MDSKKMLYIAGISDSQKSNVPDIQTIGAGQIDMVPRHLPTSQSRLQ